MRPPPLPHQIAVLERVLEKVASLVERGGGSPPVVIFDLDGTLYDSRARTLQILMEYAEEVSVEYPDVAEALSTLSNDRVQYLLSDTLRECGLTHADVVRDMTTYWRDRFFSDDYLTYDVPMPGAQEFVRACYDAGATIVYMTGRDVPGMLLGTVASLRDHGFPIAVAGVGLVLKPDATMGDEAFKRSVLPSMKRVGSPVGFFDNEPANCNMAKHLFSDVQIGLIDTQKVPGAPEPAEGVELISDFRVA